MKSILKAPGTKRLKVIYHKLLSNLAFDFNLRRYTAVEVVQEMRKVWRCRLNR
jgi:hypothetical protein